MCLPLSGTRVRHLNVLNTTGLIRRLIRRVFRRSHSKPTMTSIGTVPQAEIETPCLDIIHEDLEQLQSFEVPTLPYDLIVLIAHALWLGKESLLSFALTCRDWRIASRPLILRQVLLKGQGADVDPLASFVEILDSDPSIAILVQELRIETSPPSRWTCDPWIYSLPTMLHTRLPSLRALDFYGLGDFTLYRSNGFFSELSLFNTVKSLTIRHCCILYEALNLFVSSLPNLEHLHIHDFWLDSHSDTETFDLSAIPPCPKPPVALRSFRFHSDDGTGPFTHAFTTWIAPARSLRSCGIHVTQEESLYSVGDLLQSLGDSLEHLELRFLDFRSWSAGGAGIMKKIDLSHNTRLKSLHLHSPVHPMVPALLATVPQLESLTLSECGLCCSNFKTHDFSPLDELLASSDFKSLRTVVYKYQLFSAIGGERDPVNVIDSFRRLRSRGIFSIAGVASTYVRPRFLLSFEFPANVY